MTNGEKALLCLEKMIGSAPPGDPMRESCEALKAFMTDNGQVREIKADHFASVCLWVAQLMAVDEEFKKTCLGVAEKIKEGLERMRVIQSALEEAQLKAEAELNRPRTIN